MMVIDEEVRKDVQQLRKLCVAAPLTWRCCSTYYEIAEKWGMPLTAKDPVRDALVDQTLKEEEWTR